MVGKLNVLGPGQRGMEKKQDAQEEEPGREESHKRSRRKEKVRGGTASRLALKGCYRSPGGHLMLLQAAHIIRGQSGNLCYREPWQYKKGQEK